MASNHWVGMFTGGFCSPFRELFAIVSHGDRDQQHTVKMMSSMDEEIRSRNSCISQNFTFQPRTWPHIDSTGLTRLDSRLRDVTWLPSCSQSNAWHKAGTCGESTPFMVPWPHDSPVPLIKETESIFPPLESDELVTCSANRTQYVCKVQVPKGIWKYWPSDIVSAYTLQPLPWPWAYAWTSIKASIKVGIAILPLFPLFKPGYTSGPSPFSQWTPDMWTSLAKISRATPETAPICLETHEQ